MKLALAVRGTVHVRRLAPLKPQGQGMHWKGGGGGGGLPPSNTSPAPGESNDLWPGGGSVMARPLGDAHGRGSPHCISWRQIRLSLTAWHDHIAFWDHRSGHLCSAMPRDFWSAFRGAPWGAATDPQECGGVGGRYPPPPLQGAQPTPSHCPPDAKYQPQWHL